MLLKDEINLYIQQNFTSLKIYVIRWGYQGSIFGLVILRSFRILTFYVVSNGPRASLVII